MNKIYDSIIIGAGPAGISTAIYLKRYNLTPLVIYNGIGALENAKIENYYAIKSISGKDLFFEGIEQAKNLGIDIVCEEVLSINPYDNMEVKTTTNGYNAKSIVIATGKPRQKLLIKGAQKFLGNGISMCATCDGFFYRNKRIGIVGSGKFMEAELEVLKRFTKDIIVFTNGISLQLECDNVVNDKITEVMGDDKFEGVKTENNSYNLDGLFVAIGTANALDFANHIGIEVDSNSNIVVDNNYMTNIKGVFAAGDVIGGLLQVVKAASDGANTALSIKNYLKVNNL